MNFLVNLTFQFQRLRLWHRLCVYAFRLGFGQIVLWNACVWLKIQKRNVITNNEHRSGSRDSQEKITYISSPIANAHADDERNGAAIFHIFQKLFRHDLNTKTFGVGHSTSQSFHFCFGRNDCRCFFVDFGRQFSAHFFNGAFDVVFIFLCLSNDDEFHLIQRRLFALNSWP